MRSYPRFIVTAACGRDEHDKCRSYKTDKNGISLMLAECVCQCHFVRRWGW